MFRPCSIDKSQLIYTSAKAPRKNGPEDSAGDVVGHEDRRAILRKVDRQVAILRDVPIEELV